MKTTRALTIVTLLTGFLVACGDMPTSVLTPDDSTTVRFDSGGMLGTGGSLVAQYDKLEGTFGTLADDGESDDDGKEETRSGGMLGTGGG
jgi:hypothetical protein